MFTKPIASVFYLWYSRYPMKYSIGISITLKLLVLFLNDTHKKKAPVVVFTVIHLEI